jgi:hypothetical protein
MSTMALKRVGLALAACLVCGGVGVMAQRAPTSAEVKAQALLAARDWSRAADAFAQIVGRDPKNAQAWFRLGIARARLGDDESATAAFEKAGELGLADSPKVAWEAALAYSRLKQEEPAIDWLSRMVDQGLRSSVLKNSSEFDFMRDDPSFQALEARATGNDHGCVGEAYGALDFWVGEWVVYDRDQVRAGTDQVEKTPDGCAIVETWTGTLGDTGRSLNFLNAGTGRWTQVWIGDTGGVVQQSGGVVDGQFRFSNETQRPDGTKVTNRLTIATLEDGRVHQLAETSTDGGRTWTTQFEFTFVRASK